MRSKLNVIDQLNFIVNIDQLTSKVKLAMLDTHTHTPHVSLDTTPLVGASPGASM